MLASEISELRTLGLDPANSSLEQALKVVLKLNRELRALGKTMHMAPPTFSTGEPERGEPDRRGF